MPGKPMQHSLILIKLLNRIQTYLLPGTTGGSFYQNLKQNEEAIKDYTRSLDLDPSYVSAYINRGNTYAALGNMSASLADYNEAIRLDSNLEWRTIIVHY
jgi:tetratricopeptide (TPR) repeat protein